jgi:hypothetical protein
MHNNSSSNYCAGGHAWVWGGDLPDWPYDGMLCGCGAIKYDKREALREQIKALEVELQGLEAHRRFEGEVVSE